MEYSKLDDWTLKYNYGCLMAALDTSWNEQAKIEWEDAYKVRLERKKGMEAELEKRQKESGLYIDQRIEREKLEYQKLNK